MTTPHERDRSLEQWLTASLPDTGAPTGACLDAETAAAWLDGGLSGPARQQAETHVSTCARCQALVSAVVTLESAGAAAAEPVPSRWRGWLGWMMPLGALATAGLALAVWLRIPGPPVRPADPALPARVEPARGATTSIQAAPATPEQAPPSLAAPSRPPLGPPDVARKTAPAPPPVVGRANGAVAAASAPAPAAAPAPVDTRARAVAPAAPEAAAGLSAQQDAVANQAFAAREASGIEVASPDALVRWRLTGRIVLRSADGGAAWAPVLAEAPGRLLAGAAPSASVCWLVGERGLVLRSVDGVTVAAATAPVPSDLTSVAATSATAAVVATLDGRRFATQDGGTTWQPAR